MKTDGDAERLKGLKPRLRDKTRKPGKPPLPPNTVEREVDLALGPPPGQSTHWTGRGLAKAAGVSLRLVQRILEAHQLAPHRTSFSDLTPKTLMLLHMPAGYGAFTIESVAARSGVAKSTIYRHWSDKLSLIGNYFGLVGSS